MLRDLCVSARAGRTKLHHAHVALFEELVSSVRRRLIRENGPTTMDGQDHLPFEPFEDLIRMLAGRP